MDIFTIVSLLDYGLEAVGQRFSPTVSTASLAGVYSGSGSEQQ